MKVNSPSQSRDHVTVSIGPAAEASASLPSDTFSGASVDSQERPRKARRRHGMPQAPLQVPESPGVRNVPVAQQAIVKAIDQGDFQSVQAVLEQAADGRRLAEVLQSQADGARPASYERLMDHVLENIDASHTSRLVRTFGADLLHAMLEHRDLSRFARCCRAMHGVLLPLAAKDQGRLVRAAARDPHALSVLLDHLPSQHWPALLTEHNHEAITCLWRHAVHNAHANSAPSGTRSLAFSTLMRVFTQVPAEQLQDLHRSFSVQRHIQPALRTFPIEMLALRTLLVQRGDNVPWEDP